VATTVTQEEQILLSCIDDIDAGAWICENWSCEVHKGERPKGCAAGLVAIHSGNSEVETYERDGKRWLIHHIVEPIDDPVRWVGAPARALFALAEAADSDADFLTFDEDHDTGAIIAASDTVVTFNDHHVEETDTGYMKANEAKKWFEDALALVRRKSAA